MDLKRFERPWRAMWMRAIGRALPGPRSVDVATFDARPLRTLFVRYERIGDMIMATGLIRNLAQASATGKVDVVANTRTAPVLEGNPYVGKIFMFDRGSNKSLVQLMRRLRAERYDVIIDGRINNPETFTSTPMLMLAARAPYRIGVGGGNNDLVYNVGVTRYDRSTPYIQGSKALSAPFGVDADAVDWQPEIFLSRPEVEDAEAQWSKAASPVARTTAPTEDTTSGEGNAWLTRRLLVNLSASETKRRWADANFIEVLRHIRVIAPRLNIIIIG
ncbi:MAG: hypothetical protein ABI875_00800, partial [Gemmatimonadales bacterium]